MKTKNEGVITSIKQNLNGEKFVKIKLDNYYEDIDKNLYFDDTKSPILIDADYLYETKFHLELNKKYTFEIIVNTSTYQLDSVLEGE